MHDKKSIKAFWAGIIGNVIEHFDVSLYLMLAPFIANTFFSPTDELSALIKTYLISFIGIIIRPISTIYFARLAINKSAKIALIISLTGVTVTTGMIAFLPSYEQVGSYAPILLLIIRSLQSIFAAGEQAVAPFFILNNVKQNKFTRVSGIINVSIMLGIILASLCTSVVSMSPDPKFYWRVVFALSFLISLVGIFLRLSVLDKVNVRNIKVNYSDIFNLVTKHKIKLIRIICVSSLSYVTYSIPFIFFNSFIPLITNINLSKMIETNTILLIIDSFLIIALSFIAEKYDRNKFMGFTSLILALTIVPLFYFLDGSSYIYVLAVRIWIIFLGVAFLVPLQAWYYSLFSGDERFIVVGLGTSIASDLFGRTCPGICLFLWHYYGTTIAPGFFIAFISVIASIAIFSSSFIKTNEC